MIYLLASSRGQLASAPSSAYANVGTRRFQILQRSDGGLLKLRAGLLKNFNPASCSVSLPSKCRSRLSPRRAWGSFTNFPSPPLGRPRGSTLFRSLSLPSTPALRLLPLRVAAPPHLHLRHSLQRRRSLGSHAAEESRHKDSVAGGAKFEGDGGQPFDVKQGLADGFRPGMAERSVSFTRPPSDPVTLVARIEWWMVGGGVGTPSEDLARRNGGKSSPWFFNPAK